MFFPMATISYTSSATQKILLTLKIYKFLVQGVHLMEKENKKPIMKTN